MNAGRSSWRRELAIAAALAVVFLGIAALFAAPRFPALDQLTPLTRKVVAVAQHRNALSNSRNLRFLGHEELRLRLAGSPVEFVVNGDHVPLGSGVIAPGETVRVWARREPPLLFSPLWSRARYEDHRLPRGAGAERPRFEVVQLDAHPGRLVDYERMRRTVEFKQRAFLAALALLWFAASCAVALCLPRLRGGSGGVRVNVAGSEPRRRRRR